MRMRTTTTTTTDNHDNRRNGRTIQSPQPTEPWHRLNPDAHEHDPTDSKGPEDESQCTANKAQPLLGQLFDNTQSRLLHNSLEEHKDVDNIDRLAELRHPQVDHQWLYRVGPSTGTVTPPDTKEALRH